MNGYTFKSRDLLIITMDVEGSQISQMKTSFAGTKWQRDTGVIKQTLCIITIARHILTGMPDKMLPSFHLPPNKDLYWVSHKKFAKRQCFSDTKQMEPISKFSDPVRNGTDPDPSLRKTRTR